MTPLRLLAIVEATSITGPAKNLLEFARLAGPLGVETTIATFSRSAEESLFTRTAFQYGIPLRTVRERGPFDPAAIQGLAKLAAELRPDVIQTHAVKSHFLAWRAGLPRQAPWIAFHHGYTWPTLKARAYNQLDRWSLPAARQVLTVSRPFREELTAKGVNPERIEIVHNAIAPGWGKPDGLDGAKLRTALGIPSDRKIVLIVGRLSREKDHLTLLEAVSGLNARIPAQLAHLVVVGDGPERKRIEERAMQLGISDRVTLAGQQDSAEPYYGIADLAVLSSLSEGSPNALLEAMAAGVPVVATAVGGIPEMVTHGESALLVRPRDATGMSAAMAWLLDEPELAKALAARADALIRERHAPEARVRRLLAIYESVVAG